MTKHSRNKGKTDKKRSRRHHDISVFTPERNTPVQIARLITATSTAVFYTCSRFIH